MIKKSSTRIPKRRKLQQENKNTVTDYKMLRLKKYGCRPLWCILHQRGFYEIIRLEKE